MSLPVVLRRVADNEFSAAAEHYEQHAGLGADFIAAVQAAFEKIANDPQFYPVIEEGVREAPVLTYPYCVYYRVEVDRVLVFAVFHTSRDPALWRARI